jgi:uroporphyrinogen III methyltransferase/synthase
VVTVFLVGAGPGDPGLLTVRGAEVLRRADVVVYDRLSVASLLDLAPAGAERINVGKRPGQATLDQDAISALLVERGRSGATVVRLKGGDPFVFARGGEEARALLDAGVPFEVVPGITSAIAVPAYAGIPLTMRHSSTSFTVITGHEDPNKSDEIDWDAVARLGGTIVVLMGVGRLPEIVRRLIDGGLAADTPAAAIQWGTRPEQRTVRATLGTLTDHEIEPPSTIVVGRVAGLDLDWFESRSLFGRRVVVTRPKAQPSSLVHLLQREGAETVELPLIAISDPADGGAALRDVAARLDSYAWVVITSPNGARRLLAVLTDARAFGRAKVAAIGPGTAGALRACNVVADLVPDRHVGEALVSALPTPPSDGARVLVVRAEVTRDVVAPGLREVGWVVDEVEAYRTVDAPVTDEQRAQLRDAHIITFASSSAVDRFVANVGAGLVPPVVACIGPVTAATAEARGLHVDVVAPEHTIESLVDELVRFVTD